MKPGTRCEAVGLSHRKAVRRIANLLLPRSDSWMGTIEEASAGCESADDFDPDSDFDADVPGDPPESGDVIRTFPPPGCRSPLKDARVRLICPMVCRESSLVPQAQTNAATQRKKVKAGDQMRPRRRRGRLSKPPLDMKSTRSPLVTISIRDSSSSSVPGW